MTVTIVEPIYRVLENNSDEWVIAKASDPYLLWSAQGWVRDEDGVYIMNFPSEVDAMAFAQQQPALHLPVNDITAPWKDWPTEHLLRKIEMPEGFVAELRKRLNGPTVPALALPEAQPTPPTEPDFLRKWYELMKANDPHQFAEHEEDDGGWDSPSTVCEYTFEHFCRSSFVKSWQLLAAQPTPGWISLFRELRNAAIHGKVTSSLLDRCDEVLFPKVPSPPEPTPTKKDTK